jgi:hypothetical protein
MVRKKRLSKGQRIIKNTLLTPFDFLPKERRKRI